MTHFFKKRLSHVFLVLMTGVLFSSCARFYFKEELFPQVQELQELPSHLQGEYYSDNNNILKLKRDWGRLSLVEEPGYYGPQTHEVKFASDPDIEIKDLQGFYLVQRKDPGFDRYEYFVVLHAPEEETLLIYTLFASEPTKSDTDLIREITPVDYNEEKGEYVLQPTEAQFLEMIEKGYYEKVLEFRKK